MKYPEGYIRIHAFQVIHDYEDYGDFENEMVRFGIEELDPIPSPTAKDPHYGLFCRHCAQWAWERKDTIVPYDEFCAGKRSDKFTPKPRNRKKRTTGQNEEIRAYHDDEGHTWPQTAEHITRFAVRIDLLGRPRPHGRQSLQTAFAASCHDCGTSRNTRTSSRWCAGVT